MKADIVDLKHASPQQPAVVARHLQRKFADNVVIPDLNLEIAAGEFVVLLGRSGCGKTTLLRSLAGLDDIEGGTLAIPAVRAVVFQEPRLMLWKHTWRNVVLGLRQDGTREQALSVLAEVGLSHRADAWPATLSGGEAQRVALARALVREPDLLLLDEPFAALDALTRIRMHGLVLSLWQKHKPAVLMVTHDIDEALVLADRILVMDGGKLIAEIRHDVARPRHLQDSVIQQRRVELLRLLGVEDIPDSPQQGWSPPRLAVPARVTV